MLLNEQGVQECFTTAARTCVARGPTPSTLYGSSSAAVRDEPSSTSRSKRLRNHILLQIWLLSIYFWTHVHDTPGEVSPTVPCQKHTQKEEHEKHKPD